MQGELNILHYNYIHKNKHQILEVFKMRRNEHARMMNEIRITKERNMINDELHKVLMEIAKTYECSYRKTTEVDDNEYNYDADTFAIESIFDEIIEFIYRNYEGISTRILNKRMAEYNRIRDHYTDEEHIKYHF